MEPLALRMQRYLTKNNLILVEKLGKGYSSEVFLVENPEKERFVLKIEKEKSPRKDMVKKEAENLKLANPVGIGPKLLDFNEQNRAILMEYVAGQTFSDWLFANPDKETLKDFLRKLFQQAKTLDLLGLDHGQLAGKGRNILVRSNLPVIIDFEKASQNRRPHNVTQLASFIVTNKHSAITKKIREILSRS